MGNAYSCNTSRMGKSWGELFKENMNSMGLPAPKVCIYLQVPFLALQERY